MNNNSLLAKHQTLAVLAAVVAFLLSAFCFGQFMVTFLVINSVLKTGQFHGVPFSTGTPSIMAVGSLALAAMFLWGGCTLVRRLPREPATSVDSKP
jgi:hypothetical protein